ncbi:hypothetical protein GCM10028801_35470 [Nocardioides maradonensis]
MHRRVSVGSALFAALAFSLALLLPGSTVSASAHSTRVASSALSADRDPLLRSSSSSSFSGSKVVNRYLVDSSGTKQPIFAPSYDVHVHVDNTTELRGRERVHITWSGARPSAGRAADPFGANGMNQEYPMVLLQCRGTVRTVTPSTCFTSTWNQRSAILPGSNPYGAMWAADDQATAAQRDIHPSLPAACTKDTDPGTAGVQAYVPDGSNVHLTPFIARSGKVYSACSAATMPPEAAVDSALPPAEVAAFTDENGNGAADFEVRSADDNASLGCDSHTACTIEVIPITGISCQSASTSAVPEAAGSCQKQYGKCPPGSVYGGSACPGTDTAVTAAWWWSPSNWNNRISVPIKFGLPPNVCDLLDPRPPVSFVGSDIMSQAALQWAPAYCLNKKRFKFQHNAMPEGTAWMNMQTNQAPAAFVSNEHPAVSDPVAYAPTAITGFGIGYVIDKPNNGGEYKNLRMNARLIAKLLTESYNGRSGTDHPGMQDNPVSIVNDPEFEQLNPGLDHTDREAAATLMSLSIPSDLIETLTEYLAQDKQASEFLAGKPDPWGMVVNPAYGPQGKAKFKLPTDNWPLLDDFEPAFQDDCHQANPAVYLNQVAAPVSTLRQISDALLSGWPLVSTRCDGTGVANTYQLGRVDRQSFGSRFMMGIVSLGDAARFGLRTAAIQTTSGHYVAPTSASLSAAVKVAKEPTGAPQGPFSMDVKDVVKKGTAYPFTQIVYTAAKTHNLAQKQADTVASFIRIATTEGQHPGRGNGQLPAGYLPLTKKGVTAKLFSAAQVAARQIAAQADPTASPTGSGSGTGGTTSVPSGPVSAPAAASGGAPSAAASPSGASPSGGPTAPVTTAATQAASSDIGYMMLPTLLVLGLLASVGSVVSWFMGTRRSSLS